MRHHRRTRRPFRQRSSSVLSTYTHFSHWVELVGDGEANIGQRRAASLNMDVLLHQALHVITALSVIRGMKLGGTLSLRGSLKRDHCTAVKHFSASVDPVRILTIALVHFHVGVTLVFVVKMRLLPLLCTSTSTYVHALDSDRVRSCQVLFPWRASHCKSRNT